MKDLHRNPDMLNLIIEKSGNCFQCIGTENYFLNRTTLLQALKTTMNKWDPMILIKFSKAKYTVKREKNSFQNVKRSSQIPYLTDVNILNYIKISIN